VGDKSINVAVSVGCKVMGADCNISNFGINTKIAKPHTTKITATASIIMIFFKVELLTFFIASSLQPLYSQPKQPIDSPIQLLLQPADFGGRVPAVE
jgi:hypothetical protein